MKTIRIISNSAWEIIPPDKKLKILKKWKTFEWDYNNGRFCNIQTS